MNVPSSAAVIQDSSDVCGRFTAMTFSITFVLTWSPLKTRNVFRDRMEGLHVDCENCGLRFKDTRVVERPNLDNHRSRPGRTTCANCGATGWAKRAGDRTFQIGAREFLRRTFGVTKILLREHHDRVRISTCDVLALSAVTLQRTLRIAARLVPNLPAITPTCISPSRSPI